MTFCTPWNGSTVAMVPRSETACRARPASSGRPRHRPGARSNNLAAGWCSSRVKSMIPVSSRGPRRHRPWWCRRGSPSSTRTPTKRNEPSAAAVSTGWMWDHTVFHVVPSWRVAQRIARTPSRVRGTHTARFYSVKVTVSQVFSRCIQRRSHHRIHTGAPCPEGVDRIPRHPAVTGSDNPAAGAPGNRATRLDTPGPSPRRTARPRSGGNPPHPTHPHPTRKSQIGLERGSPPPGRLR